jgi:hypothetical protein
MLRRTQVLLEAEQYRLLKEEALRRGQSVSSLVREIVQQWLIRNDPIWEVAGIIADRDDVPRDVSENVDKYVYRADWLER